MRHSAAPDRFARTCLAESDGVLRAGRMKKNHGLAFPESNLQSQRFLVKARRAMDIADVQVDVIEHARCDHGATSLRFPGRLRFYEAAGCETGGAVSNTCSRWSSSISAAVIPSTSDRIAALSAPTRDA